MVWGFSYAKPVNPIFNHYVAVGDSLTHGFQSGAVDETRQPNSYPALLAKKMQIEFDQPLLKFPGYLINIEDFLKGNIRWWQYYYPIVGGVRRDNYKNSDILDNFGVTGADIKDGLDTTGKSGGYFKLVLGKDGASMIDQAIAQKPTFMTFWLGNNDVLGAALSCDTSKLTPIDTFRTRFEKTADRIASAMEDNGGTIRGVVLVNVPSVTSIAYLQKVTGPDFAEGSYNPFWMMTPSDNMMLSPDDISMINQRTQEVNDEISYVAMANGWGYVDANAIFKEIKEYGHRLRDVSGDPTGDRVITAEYLGGLFSLDGVHPSNTGHAVAANYIIDEINEMYGVELSHVSEINTAASDSLLQHPVDPRNKLDGWVADAIYGVVEIFM